jgi:hypothetical protein
LIVSNKLTPERARKISAKPKGRRYLVSGVNLGDGEFVRAWFIISKDAVIVRRYRAHRTWMLSLKDAAGAVARAAQLREASYR